MAAKKKTASSAKRTGRTASRPRPTGAWKLSLSPETLPSFLLCLGLGTLQAIRRGALPTEAGLWTLAVPGFLGPLRENRVLPPRVLAVFEQSDELNALAQLSPGTLEPTLDEFTEALDRALASEKETGWAMGSDWEVPTPYAPPKARKPRKPRRRS